MKGIIFNVLEDFIVENWGEDTFDQIFASCPLKTREPFVGPGTYPDSDLTLIVMKTCERLGTPPDLALRLFGCFLFEKLAARYPLYVEPHTHPKPFLLSIHDTVHVEVRKLFPGSITPEFEYVDSGEGLLTVKYRSKRKLCYAAEGLIQGALEHYGVPARIAHTTCLHKGDECCTFELDFRTTTSEVA